MAFRIFDRRPLNVRQHEAEARLAIEKQKTKLFKTKEQAGRLRKERVEAKLKKLKGLTKIANKAIPEDRPNTVIGAALGSNAPQKKSAKKEKGFMESVIGG